ncbi:MAG TPA: radical SAM protein, partial [Thermoanaerobaculia bacterium]|nr:radical SAM protein [Thermoanaerobaculia bacterium]
MRVALVNPRLMSAATVQPPLALCTLAAHLVPGGHEIRLVDLDLETRLSGADARQAVSRQFRRELHDFAPDVVAFTSMYNNSLQVAELCRESRGVCPDAVTVAGGPHFGAQGTDALASVPALDFVIEGEAEVAFAQLLRAVDGDGDVRTVSNLCYRAGGEIHRNPRAPLMDLALSHNTWETIAAAIDLRRYTATIDARDLVRGIYVEAGRGCPYHCTFCAPAEFWGRKYRVRGVATLLAEVRYLHEELGYDSFILVHDLLTADRAFTAELCEAFLDARMPVRWMANARTDIKLDDLFARMRVAGCWKLFYGIESASPRIQTAIAKRLSPAGAFETIRAVEAHGIDATCSFVIGHAGETADELSDSLRLGARMKLLGAETVQFHRLRLFPPAPLAAEQTDAELDLDTLRLEYPYADVAPAEIEAVRRAPGFYSGYFAPRSAAGSARELAQVELFFTQAVAIVPMTVLALAEFAPFPLVDVFREVLTELGPVDRMAFDPTDVDLLRNFGVLEPYVGKMIERTDDA